VERLKYVSGTITGVTDQNGTYHYEVGLTVKFYVGDILVGETTPKAILTPRDLVAGANIDNPIVLNISRFLLSLDNDNDPTNGIFIPQSVIDNAIGMTIDFTTVGAATLDNLIMQVTGKTSVVTDAEARDHLTTTMLNLLAGTYSGTYTGADAGTWTVTIDSLGNISGSGFSTTTQVPFEAIGFIGPNGDMSVSATGEAGGATYEGIIDIAAGITSGTWRFFDNSGGGTFSGHKMAAE
jgi:hypothetical protein